MDAPRSSACASRPAARRSSRAPATALNGPGLRATKTFTISGDDGATKIVDAHLGSKGAFVTGIVLTPLGLAVGAIGGAMVGNQKDDQDVAPAATLAAVGAVVFFAGIALLIKGSSTVTVDGAKVAAAKKSSVQLDLGGLHF